MKGRYYYFNRILKASLVILTVVLCNQTAGADSAIKYEGKDIGHTNGEMTLWMADNNQVHKLGALAYGKHITSNSIDVSNRNLSGNVRLYITHKGNSAAHIDAVLIDNRGPVSVDGTIEDKGLAIRKLTAVNNDLIDAHNRRIQFDFYLSQPAQKITLAARIEPEQLSPYAFFFPPENLYSQIDTRSLFYEYAIDRQTGEIGIDQITGTVKPFFKVFSKSGSGHPSEFTYGWVSNDAKNLYVTIDFSGDNTLDRNGKDYARVYINTKEGIKIFSVTQEKREWGIPKFTYTASNSFQHRVYEFVIPFLALGTTMTENIKIAFEVYGTNAAPPPPTPPAPPQPVSLPDPVDPADLIDLNDTQGSGNEQ